MDLASDKIKLTDDLERLMNSDISIDHKIKDIKSLLLRIGQTDITHSTLDTLISNNTKEETKGIIG